MKIKWSVVADKVEERLQQMSLKGEDKTKALQGLGRVLTSRIRIGFVKGRDPWGNTWPQLNTYFRRGRPLRDTGQLMNSLSVARIEGDSVIVGTNLQNKGVSYPAVQQYGAEIKPVHAKALAFRAPAQGGAWVYLQHVTIPARPFLPLQDGKIQLPKEWAESALRSLVKSLGLEGSF